MLREMIGMRIKELRISKKSLSQSDFAYLLGFDRTFLSRIENGKQNITIDNIIKICNCLDISLSDFFEPFNEVGF